MLKYADRLLALLFLAVTLASCASDTMVDPAPGNFRLQAEMTTNRVAIAQQKSSSILAKGATVDSLVITSAKFMISEIKLQQKGIGTEENFKTVPVILTVDQNGSKLVSTGSLPPDTYNKIRFKYHRLNDSEIQPWIGNPDFADFVTQDRYTIIIAGFVYVNGQAQPFTYGSKVEEDQQFELVPFAISDATQTVIAFQLETPEVFKDKDTGKVLDPRDLENHNRIDDAIKTALNAIVK